MNFDEISRKVSDGDDPWDDSPLKAALVGLQLDQEPESQASLDELASLVETLGWTLCGTQLARLREPNAATLLGQGKTQELVIWAQDLGAEVLILDTALSPSQQRNWEALFGGAVIDREEVILEIFAQRAQTKEASLQVGLARLQYSLPRLTRRYTGLSQQRGGAKASRGPGETQLEIDRRLVMNRMDVFKKELEKVRKQRQVGRRKRSESPLPAAAIVGYTNAGKSSLLNLLTNAGILAEDKLFATLDPTTRQVNLGPGLELLLTDTVGFIQRLPHGLVEAFKATLEESLFADFLVHLVDGSHPRALAHYETTREVLAELGAQDKPELLVFNKADRSSEDNRLFLSHRFPQAFWISVKTGEGVQELLEAFKTEMDRLMSPLEVLIPLNRGDLVALAHRTCRVLVEEYREAGVYLRLQAAAEVVETFRNYGLP